MNFKTFVQLVGIKTKHLGERLKLKNALAELGIQCSFCTFLIPKYFSCLKTLPSLLFFLFLFLRLLVMLMGWGREELFYQVSTAKGKTWPFFLLLCLSWAFLGSDGWDHMQAWAFLMYWSPPGSHSAATQFLSRLLSAPRLLSYYSPGCHLVEKLP